MIIGHWHTAFTVSNIEKTVRFYTELLNFEVVHRQRQNNEYTRKFVGFKDADIATVMLRIPGCDSGRSGHVLELNQYYAPKGEKLSVETCNIGSAHLALLVEDINKTYEFLKLNGVKFKSPPIEIQEGRNKGGFTCYFLDPDGITLEIVQPSEKF